MAREKKTVGVEVRARDLEQVVGVVTSIGPSGHVELSVVRGELDVFAASVYGSVRATLPAEGNAEEFRCVVAADVFRKTVHEMRAPTLRLGPGGLIVAGSSRYRLAASEVQYSAAHRIGAVVGGDVPRAPLLAAISAVRHAAYTQMDRSHIACVAVQRTRKHLLAVATDGHRMARVIDDAAGGPDLEMLVPIAVVPTLVRLLECLGGESVQVGRQKEHVTVAGSEPREMAMRFRGEPWSTYPAHERFFAVDDGAEPVRVGAEELRAAVTRAAIVSRYVLLGADESHCLVVSAQDGTGATARELVELPADGPLPPALPVSLDARYLLDALALCADEPDGLIELTLPDAVSPARLTGAPGRGAVIMPARP